MTLPSSNSSNNFGANGSQSSMNMAAAGGANGNFKNYSLEEEAMLQALARKDAEPNNSVLLQNFLTLALTLVSKNPSCMWCKNGDWVVELLFLYTLTETEAIKQYKAQSAAALANCSHCTEVYHVQLAKIMKKFEDFYEADTLKEFQKLLVNWDVARIKNVFSTHQRFISSGFPHSEPVPVPILTTVFEVLKYPYLLFHDSLNEVVTIVLEALVAAKRMVKPKSVFPGLIYYAVHESYVIQGWAIPTLHSLICGPKIRLDDREWELIRPVYIKILGMVVGNLEGLERHLCMDKNRFLSGVCAGIGALQKDRLADVLTEINPSSLVSSLINLVSPEDGSYGMMEALRCLCVLQTLMDKTIVSCYREKFRAETEEQSLMLMFKCVFCSSSILRDSAKEHSTNDPFTRLERFPHFLKTERRDVPFVFLNYFVNEWTISKAPFGVELAEFMINHLLETVQSTDYYCSRIKYLGTLLGLKLLHITLPMFCDNENGIWRVITPNVTTQMLDCCRLKNMVGEKVVPDILCSLYEIDANAITNYVENLLTDSTGVLKPLNLSGKSIWIPFCKANLNFLNPRIYGKLVKSYSKIIFIDVAFIQNILAFCNFDETTHFLENINVVRDAVLCLREFLRNVYRHLPLTLFNRDYLSNSEEWKTTLPAVLYLLCSPIDQEATALESFLNKIYRKNSFNEVFVTITDQYPALVVQAIIDISCEMGKWLKLGLPLHFSVRRTAPFIAMALGCIFRIGNNRCVGTVLDDCPDRIELLSKFWVAFWDFTMLFAEKAGLFMQVPEIIKVDLNVSVVFRSLQSVIISLLDLSLSEIFVSSKCSVRMKEDMDRWLPTMCYLIGCDLKTKYIGIVRERSLALMFWIFKVLKISNLKLGEKSHDALKNLTETKGLTTNLSEDEVKRICAWIKVLEDEKMVKADSALSTSTNTINNTFDTKNVEKIFEVPSTVSTPTIIPDAPAANSDIVVEIESSALLLKPKRKREEEEQQQNLDSFSSILVPKKKAAIDTTTKESPKLAAIRIDDNGGGDDGDDESDDDYFLVKQLQERNQALSDKLKQELQLNETCMLFEIGEEKDSEFFAGGAGAKGGESQLDQFHRDILKGMNNILDGKGGNHEDHSTGVLAKIPNVFAGFDDYKNIWLPLLMTETRGQLLKSKDEISVNASVGLSVRSSLELDGKFCSVTFDLKCPSRSVWESSNISVNDLVALQLVNNNNSSVSSSSSETLKKKLELALVKAINHRMEGVEIVVDLYAGDDVMVVECLRNNGSFWMATKIMSLNTVCREYMSLMDLSSKCRPEITNQILKPSCIPYSPSSSILKGIVTQFRLNYRVNEGQALAILTCLYSPNPFVLIQGPPGTGKTKVIVTLLSSLLFPQFFFPSPIEQPKRLLVCAPSNAAVDELVRRVGDGLIGENSDKIVRLGKDCDIVSAQGKLYLLDNLLEQRLERSYPVQCLELTKNKNRLAALEAEIKASHGDAGKLKMLLEEANRIKVSQKDNVGFLDTMREPLRQAIINEARIVFCTLSGSGQEILSKVEGGFETVIIDEACQSVELSALIPLKYGCKRCVLVGDPNQLPATLFSTQAARYSYDQSLFERIYKCDPNFSIMLNTQYRMNPEISKFPSQYFYDSKLLDGPNMRAGCRKAWHQDQKTGPYVFYDVPGQETFGGIGRSLMNSKEAEFIATLIGYLGRENSSQNLSKKITVLTPYKQQRNEITRKLEEVFGANTVPAHIEVKTIDAFQGQESDIVIVSCVRAGSSRGIGFFSDLRRMNVSLTRARFNLFIVGHGENLARHNEAWKGLVEDAKKRGLYRSYKDVWSGPNDGKIFAEQPVASFNRSSAIAAVTNAIATFSNNFGHTLNHK